MEENLLNFVDKWNMFVRVRCPPNHPTNSIKAKKKTQNTEMKGKERKSIYIAPFTAQV